MLALSCIMLFLSFTSIMQGQQYYSDKLTLSFDVFCRKETKPE